MTDQTPSLQKSPAVLAVLIGGFVWLVFDSLALGVVAAFTTFFLMKRDHEEDAEDE